MCWCLLDKVPPVSLVTDCLSSYVPKCPSTARVPRCLSAQVLSVLSDQEPKCTLSNKVPQVPECSSVQVCKCFKCSSAQMLFECLSGQVPLEWPLSALGVPCDCLISLLVIFEERKSAVLQEMDSLKTFQNTCFTLHFSPSLEIRCGNFTAFCKADLMIQRGFKNLP